MINNEKLTLPIKCFENFQRRERLDEYIQSPKLGRKIGTINFKSGRFSPLDGCKFKWLRIIVVVSSIINIFDEDVFQIDYWGFSSSISTTRLFNGNSFSNDVTLIGRLW